LHMAQLMPMPLTVSCFSKIQTGFTFLVSAHLGSPGKGPLNRCVFHKSKFMVARQQVPNVGNSDIACNNNNTTTINILQP